MKIRILAIQKSILTLLFLSVLLGARAQSVNHLVISQVYGGGGNAGASYLNDFVELYNPTGSTINLSGLSIQYASATGTTAWTSFSLPASASIAPGKYYLVQMASGGAVGIALPTADATSTINMSATTGKVALVNGTTAISGACPTTNMIDLVGFGSPNCFEGTAAATAPSAANSISRKSNGCQDTDSNTGDFTAGSPSPRNSATAANSCVSCVVVAGTVSSNQSICSGLNPSNITLSGYTGTIQWQSSTNNSSFSNISGQTTATLAGSTIGTLTATAYYRAIVTGVGGCTATTGTVTVTVRQPSTSTTTISNPVSYTWNGTTYTQSGIYTFSTTNAAGCDSTATLNLTITPASCIPTSSTTSAIACNSYAWNGTTYTTSGTYSYLTLNAGGCDSTAYLNLTLGYTSTSSTTVSTCNPSYTWNNNTYTSSGIYTYTTTNATGCDSTATLYLSINTFSTVTGIFSESMGTVGGTTAIATHETNNGFDNDGYTMSGTADIRSTSVSTGYAGASGGANVYFATNGTASFQIEGINTLAATGLQLRYAQYKNSTTSNGSELVVETSTDGVTYNTVTMSAMPTGTGTAAWSIRSSSSALPLAANLRVRWRTTSSTIQFRIDDISMTKLVTGPAIITASGATTFCPGGSVSLSASNGASFLWNTSENTQTISASSTGTYYCTVTDANGCTSQSNSIVVQSSDNIPPTVVCQNITVGLDINGEAIITASQINNGSSDNCGIASIAISNDYFTSNELGANTVTLTVTDVNGNSASCDAIVTIIDGIGPTVSCNNITVYLDSTGTANISAAQVDGGSFDGDGIASTTISRNTFSCADLATTGIAAPTDLIISEYVEGSTSNKAIELYNGTSSPVDLTAGNYQLRFFYNGAIASGAVINLTGVVAPGATYVVCSNTSSPALQALANQVSSVAWFNGDDAVELSKFFGIIQVDVFGREGEDPGNGWGQAPLTTVDQTLRRRSTITNGVAANPASGFPTLNSEWNASPVDDISNIGAHYMNFGSGVVSVTLSVADSSGNVSTCLSQVTVLDTIGPVAHCKNATLYLDGSGNANLVPAQIDNGSYDNCSIVNAAISKSAFSCADIGSNAVTLTVYDVNGFSASCNATVTVLDTLPPVARFKNAIAYLDASGNASITAAQVNNASSDNCAAPTFSISPSSFSCANTGIVSTPTDLFISEQIEGSSNNKCVELYNGTSNTIDLAAGGYQLRVYFNGATTFTAINLTGTVAPGSTYTVCSSTATAAFTALANQLSASMTYNGNDALVLYKTSGAQILDVFGRIGENPGTAWTSGSLSTVDQTLVRKSTVISGVASNPASGFPTLGSEWQSLPVDNISSLGMHNVVIGNNVVQLTVTDAGGNSITIPAGVTVLDTIKPVASCQNVTVQLGAGGTASITASQINNGSTDNCGIASLSVSPNSFTCSNLGSNSVTLTVTDNSGNTATCTALVTVNDVIDPTITAPAAVSATTNTGCTATGVSLGTPVTNDNCSVASVTNNAPSAFPLGNTTVTWTVTDGSGNTATASQIVTVTDNVNPTITATAAISATTNTGCTATGVSLGTPVTNDNCSVASVTNNAPSAFPLGSTTVTWTVTDGSGRTATATQIVTVTDNVNPTITAPAAISATTNTGCTATGVSLGTPVTNDNCSVASVTNNAPSAFPLGNTTVTWTVTDGSGRTATATQIVAVTDNVNPTITAPAAVSATTNTGCTATGVSLGTPVTNDNCSVASVTNNAPSAFPLGNTTVTWTVTDGSGNTATATQVVTISDNVNPTITAPAAVSATTNTGCTATGVSLGTPVTNDNCSVASVTNNAPSAFPVGTTTVVWTVTDGSGNTATASQTVTVTDNINPTAVCQNITIQLNSPGTASITSSQVNNGSYDNCGVASVSVSPNSFNCANVGANTVILTVTDVNGNTGTCNATVTVQDNIAPIAVCKNVTIQLNGSGVATVTAAQVNNGSSDNCGIASLSLSKTSFNCSNVGANTVTLTVTDVNGNTSTCSATVNVQDVTAPVITCPANIAVLSSTNQCGAVVNFAAPVYSDACTATLVQTAGLPSGSLFPVGTTVNTFTATDPSGNQTSCSFSVSVTDVSAPVITNVPSNFSSCNPVTWTTPTITDNCAGVQVTSSHLPGSTFPSGTTTVTYTAVDVYGNTSSASFNVTVLQPSVAASSISSDRDFNNICSGESITLTINGGVLGAGATWKWYSGSCGGTALPAFNGQTSITVTPSTTTTYFARAEGQCNATACASITVVVSSGNGPVGGVTYSYIPANAAPGVTDSLVVVPVPGATYYRWYTINGHINSILFNGSVGPVQTSVNSVNVSFVLPEQNYQLRCIAGNACGRTQPSSSTVRGTVAAPTCLNGPTQVCPGQTASYTVCAIPSQTTVTYNWQLVPSGAGVISGTGLTRNITFAAGFTSAQLCVNGVSSFGLAGPQYCITISTAAPAPGVVSGNTVPCQGSTISYSVQPVNGAISYTWTSSVNGALVSGSGTTGTISFPANAFSGNVCVASNSSCGQSAPSCVTVNSGTPGVPGPISGPVSGICGASNVNFSLGTSNANTYNWILPAGVTISGASNLNAANLNFGAGFTSGNIVVEAFYDCGSATSSIMVNGAPSAPSITPGTICASTDQLYTAAATGATSYSWIVSGQDYSSCTNPPVCSQYYVLWSAAGGTMSVSAANTCGTSTTTSISGSGCRVNENGELLSNAYPNPTTGMLTVEFNAVVSGNHQIIVTDISGRVLTEKVVNGFVGNVIQESIDLSGAGEGFYMLYIKDPKGHIAVSKVTVE